MNDTSENIKTDCIFKANLSVKINSINAMQIEPNPTPEESHVPSKRIEPEDIDPEAEEINMFNWRVSVIENLDQCKNLKVD